MKAIKTYFMWSIFALALACVSLAIELRIKPYSSGYHARVYRVPPVINSISAALELHKHEKGNYPLSLEALVPEYLSSVIADPWHFKYTYRFDSAGYEVYSVGTGKR